jgi:hypothetical protein
MMLTHITEGRSQAYYGHVLPNMTKKTVSSNLSRLGECSDSCRIEDGSTINQAMFDSIYDFNGQSH